MLIDKFIEYLRKEKKYSEYTCGSYGHDLRGFEAFVRGLEVDLITVGKEEIRLWMIQMMEEKYHANTINRKISALRSFYGFLIKIGEVKDSPVAQIKSLKKNKRYVLPFSPAEVRMVLEHNNDDLEWTVDRYNEVRDYVILELLYATGMRRSELLDLKINDIDMDGRQIKVRGKRDKERIIPLLENTIGVLFGFMRLHTLKFPHAKYLITNNKGEKAYPGLIYKVVKRNFEMFTTKEKKSPHVLRHSFATHLLDNGVSLQEVKDLLGHAGLSSTQVYTHTSLRHLKNAYRKAHPRYKKKDE